MIEIYADIVLLINFVMDFLIFWIVSKLIKRKITLKKLLLGGFIASFLFCLVIFVPFLRQIYNLPCMLGILMLAINFTFNPKDVREFFKLILLTNITSFCIGGMGIALFYFTNISNVIGNMIGFYVEDFSFKLLLIISSTAYIVIKLSIYWIRRVFIKKQKFYTVKIFFESLKTEFTALLDTGNSLKDPLTQVPVIIAEFNQIKNFLPNDLKIIFYENRENDYELVINNISPNIAKRIRMIPFESIGEQNGMLLGFRPDKVEVRDNENNFIIEEVVIGIYNFRLSKDDSYQGLLNPEVIVK